MCGIAGIAAITPSASARRATGGGDPSSLPEVVAHMADCMRHRGPDDRGIEVISGDELMIGLGHTRLAIIDLSQAGHQPMSDATGKFWINYNGEVYNYRELREELRFVQIEWKSQTDTEVILNAYEHWGVEAFKKLRGMFAFALWDERHQQLLLVRDHLGIKPVYYYATPERFMFASEVRTLLNSGLVPRRMDAEGLRSFLRYGAIESPLTIIHNVRSLAPGHYLAVRSEQGRLRVDERAYAEDLLEPAAGSAITDRREAVSELRQILEEAVRVHLVSDVPLAAFLSGGIDSSAIVALMSRVTCERPKTFTITFDEEEFSEGNFSRLIAKQFGTEHQEILLSEASLLGLLPEAFSSMDQPTIDGLNTYVISQAVKRAGITVALSGVGGDELFAGYPSFRRVQKLRSLGAIPAALRQAAARAGQTFFGGSVQQRKAWHLLAGGGTPRSVYSISRQLFSWEEIAALLGGGRQTAGDRTLTALDRLNGHDDPLNSVSRYELQGYMTNVLLRDTDQMSMAHSLEVRTPFVDRVVIPFVLGLPGNWKVDGQRPKPLLVDALADLLPPEIWHRPKMGFTLPFERWMRSALKLDLSETFAQPLRFQQLGISDYSRKVWATFDQDMKKERWARPWALYVLKRWCDLNGVQ